MHGFKKQDLRHSETHQKVSYHISKDRCDTKRKAREKYLIDINTLPDSIKALG